MDQHILQAQIPTSPFHLEILYSWGARSSALLMRLFPAPKWKLNQSSQLQLYGIIRGWAAWPSLCAHVVMCAFGVMTCQTNHFTAGGSNSFNIKYLLQN